MHIPLAQPDITETEIKAVVGIFKTSYLALGPELKEFGNAIADYAGVRYAVAVNSGTSALHLIIRALRIGKGDEVSTTPSSLGSSQIVSSLTGQTWVHSTAIVWRRSVE